jgi:excisionase family DNA binding protein
MNIKMCLTVEETAKVLGIGRNLALKLTNEPDFPVIRFRRRKMINSELLQEWLNQNSGRIII